MERDTPTQSKSHPTLLPSPHPKRSRPFISITSPMPVKAEIPPTTYTTSETIPRVRLLREGMAFSGCAGGALYVTTSYKATGNCFCKTVFSPFRIDHSLLVTVDRESLTCYRLCLHQTLGELDRAEMGERPNPYDLIRIMPAEGSAHRDHLPKPLSWRLFS